MNTTQKLMEINTVQEIEIIRIDSLLNSGKIDKEAYTSALMWIINNL